MSLTNRQKIDKQEKLKRQLFKQMINNSKLVKNVDKIKKGSNLGNSNNINTEQFVRT